MTDRWPGHAAVACAGPPGGRASGSVRGRADRHPAGRPRPHPFHPEASGQLWTRALTGELIFKLYRVRFAEPGVGKYLERWGLTFRRPDKRAVEQHAETARLWHEETWPASQAMVRSMAQRWRSSRCVQLSPLGRGMCRPSA
ncbi:helix-turn-helix domain-containing protein [Streptomyces wedmorensis]